MLANTSIKVVFDMPFLFLNNADIEFAKLEKPIQRSYDIAEPLLITNQIKLISKKEFAKVAPNENFKTYVMHITALKVIEPVEMPIHPF